MSRRQNIVSEISSDFLTCHICLETYDRPKTLPCGHFFCRDCFFDFCQSNSTQQSPTLLSGITNGSSSGRLVHCPTCRKPVGEIKAHASVSAFVDQLPDNFYVNSLKDLVYSHARKRSTRTRSDRGEGLNPQNVDQKKIQRSRSLASGACGGWSTTSTEPLGFPCTEHPHENINFYCPVHSKVLCTSCLMSDHSECDGCLSIEDAEERYIRPRVKLVLRNLTDRKMAFENILTQMARQRQSLQVDMFDIEKQIDDCKRRLEIRLAQCFAGIKEDLNTTVSLEGTRLVERHDSAKMKEGLISETISNLDTLARKGSIYELASVLSVTDIQVEAIAEDSKNIHNIISTTIRLDANSTLTKLLNSDVNIFGKILLAESQNIAGDEHEQGAVAMQLPVSTVDDDTRKIELSKGGGNVIDVIDELADLRPVVAEANCHYREEPSSLYCFREEKSCFTIAAKRSASKCCMLTNGDVALVSPLEKSLTLYKLNGVVVDSIVLPTLPLGLASCKDSKKKISLALTGYGCKVYFLSTLPRLKLVTAMPTRVQYTSISGIPRRLSLVCSAPWEKPPAVDLLSLQGLVLKTFTYTSGTVPLFNEPNGISTTSEFLFVCDGKCLKIVSWDSKLVSVVDRDHFEGNHFGDLKAICTINGVTFIADCFKGRVYAVPRIDNQWVCTTVFEDQALQTEPCGLSAGPNGVAVLSGGQTVRVFSVEKNTRSSEESLHRLSPLLSTTNVEQKYQTQ